MKNKILSILLAIISLTLLIGCTSEDVNEDADEKIEVSKEVEVDEVEAEIETEETVDEAEADTGEWDEMKNHENIVGKSNKEFSEVTKNKPSEVRNDTTGKWRKTRVSENIDFTEYALSYKDLHMNDGEIHFIINFNLKTTTSIKELMGLVYVDVFEYVDKEEHDASVLGSGMPLGSYIIYPDGDIEKIEQ